MDTTAKNWTEVIESSNSLFDLRLKEVWRYRDLLRMFVKRDFVAIYKQTILGPLWFFIQPLLTTIVFTIVFGNFAGVDVGKQPKILFFLSGVTIWNYFADCFTKTSTVFKDNASLFGKVYFPRLIIPLSIIVSGLIRFMIQFILFIGFVVFFVITKPTVVHPNWYALLTPFLIVLMGGFALGGGMIISSLTTKYRDLAFLLTFGVQLLMYTVPVVYSTDSPRMAPYKDYVALNPLSSIVETFRYAFLGSGHFAWGPLLYSTLCMVVLLAVGTLVFNKNEKSFMDTV